MHYECVSSSAYVYVTEFPRPFNITKAVDTDAWSSSRLLSIPLYILFTLPLLSPQWDGNQTDQKRQHSAIRVEFLAQPSAIAIILWCVWKLRKQATEYRVWFKILSFLMVYHCKCQVIRLILVIKIVLIKFLLKKITQDYLRLFGIILSNWRHTKKRRKR